MGSHFQAARQTERKTANMVWGNLPLLTIFFVTFVWADLCPGPVIPNGEVKNENVKNKNVFFGEVTCNKGYHLVGASKTIKCRHGVWSQKELPVCSAIGACPSLPNLINGRNVPIQNSRGSAYRFKCNRGFKRFGELRTHCEGNGWSHASMPICAKATCEETGMLDIPYGEGRAMLRGAVYKYRCNLGVEMEGSSTLVCGGERWNGTVPHCNVGPSEPELEVTVSGNAVTTVKPGDVVLVTCRARVGHPVPDIGLTLDGLPTGSKDFMNLEHSFTFTATENEDGQRILCSAVNKIGTSATSTILHVHAAPTNAAISGPETVHHEDEFTYECSVEGGNPEPEISWTISDHLGETKEVNGQKMGPGLSRMSLKTGSKERMITINCSGKNTQGIVSHTKHVHTHYLPKSVAITGPSTALPGDYAHFTCLTSETFPVPALKWKIEKSGEFYEVDESDGDVSSEGLEDGGAVAYAKTDILIEDGFENALIQCVVVVEGQEVVMSEKHKIDVISIEDPQETSKTNKNEYDSVEKTIQDFSEEDVLSAEYENDGPKLVKLLKLENIEDIDEKTLQEEDDMSAKVENNEPKLVKLVKIENIQNIDAEERNKISWMPLKPVEDMDNYQQIYAEEHDEVAEEDSDYEHFLRPSPLPETPMLKQEKEIKSQVVESSFPVAMVYSSSSTLFASSIVLLLALPLSTL